MKLNEKAIKRYPVKEEELKNLKVEVYRNLHKNMWSVRALEGCYKGKVILNTPEVILNDSVFLVSEKGRQWVLDNKVKKVHAVIRGFLDNLSLNEDEKKKVMKNEIYYNPYTTSKFLMRYTNEILTKEYMKVKFTEECKVYKY